MKVILTKDIPGVGKKFDVKELADGYARNFVLARGLGVAGTAEELAKIEKLKTRLAKEDEVLLRKLDEMVRILNDRHIDFELKTDEHGSVFGSVSRDAIAKELRNTGWCAEEHTEIRMEHPLKSFGEHKVTVLLPKGKTAQLKVIVRSS